MCMFMCVCVCVLECVFGAEHFVTCVGLYLHSLCPSETAQLGSLCCPQEPHSLPDSVPPIQPLFYNFAITPLYAEPRPEALACWDVSPATDCSHEQSQ